MANPTPKFAAISYDEHAILCEQLVVNGKVVVADQQALVADYAITWTSNEPTAGDSATISNGTVPTVAELGQAVADITAKVNAILAILNAHGLMADA